MAYDYLNRRQPKRTTIQMKLSKSRYTQGAQCPKMLWMREKMPEQFDDSVMNQSILENGNAVGDLAMGYYGPFIEVAFDSNDPNRFNKAKEETAKLLAEGHRTICEATFSTGKNYCMVDILRVRDDGSFDLVEVKSSTQMKDIYLHDMAYQCWVLEQCGFVVHSASLMHINNQYVRSGELDLHELFCVEEHTPEVFELVSELPSRLFKILEIADSKSEPDIPIGLQCFNPYECGFRKWCFRNLPENNVFDIAGLRKKKAFDFLDRGSVGFSELVGDVEAFSKLSDKQQMQVLTEINGLGPSIDKDAIAEFLDNIWYPLHFLDFETFQEAIPSFDGQKPYDQITSQYSLHWIDRPNGNLKHTEFLGEAGTDPRRQVAEHLCKDIPENACIIAWNMGFEKGRIHSMAKMFPDLAPHLMAIHANVRDLMTPFQKGHYYTKEMEGSSSIKKVLPALFPNNPELDYYALDGIHNGGEASNAFQHLAELSLEDQKITREQLLRYCELDTLAMVRIWEKLTEACN